MEKIKFSENIYTFQIDFAGHVSNIVYIEWMEIGRLKLLEAVGMPIHEVVQLMGLLPTLIKTEISYHKQLFLGDTVQIEVWLSRLRNVSANMEFRFFNAARELTASGCQTGLFIDSVTHKPTPLGKEALTAFRPFVEAGS
jgi:acyl-CoA thioester hydrolase